MTTIDHAGRLAVSRPQTLSDEHIAARALAVARRTALGVLGDAEAAADVAQEVAITAVRPAGPLRGPPAPHPRRPRAPLARAPGVPPPPGRGGARGARRPGRRRGPGRPGHAPPPAAAPAAHAADPALAGSLALLDGLPARQRAALTLRYVHDLPDAAIARALGCRPGTVRSLLSRGRDALRAATASDPETSR